MARVQIYPDLDSLVAGAADLFADLAVRSIAGRGRFAVALAGGSMPRPLFGWLTSPQRRFFREWHD